MELFAYLGAGSTCVGTAIAAHWALHPPRSVAAQLAVITVLAWVIFDRANSFGAYLLTLEYLSWVHAVMMLALGCTLRLADRRTTPSWRWVARVSVVAGLAVSPKVTLAVFALPLALLVLFCQRSLGSMVAATLAIGGIASSILIALTDPKPGDRLDIAKAEIFAARYP